MYFQDELLCSVLSQVISLEDVLKTSSRRMASKNIFVDILIDQEALKTFLPRLMFAGKVQLIEF